VLLPRSIHEAAMKTARNALIAVITAITATLTGGCATVPPASPVLAPQGVALERDFRGRFYAKGVFTNRITGSARAFNVVLNGKWDGKTLTLREDFAYADGEKDVKTWVFRRISPTQWTGTREDVVGNADVQVAGGVVRISYDIDLPTSSGAVRLRFEDVIERNQGGIIVNRAIVSKFGLPLGDVDLTFSRKPL
jgi:hypothetical protein